MRAWQTTAVRAALFALLLPASTATTASGAPNKDAPRASTPRPSQSRNAQSGLPSPAAAPYCHGEYADSLLALNPKSREIEDQPFSYCIRSTATYECLSYAADGNVRRQRRTAVAHGTGFGFKQQNGTTFILTNHHVAEWPLVTDDHHSAGNVPIGCKKIADTLFIVDNESDTYDRDDVVLTRVAADPQLDASVLKAKDPKLKIIPWKLGKSSALRERNVVEVRGFPLGVFQAISGGKVISAYDHDTDKEWDHDDFVIDALLSRGNSGSPVLAVSCKTGEFELVGVHHAGYTGASALNVAIGIDQLRDMMTTLKKKPRSRPDGLSSALDPAARARLMRNTPSVMESFFPFGPLAGLVLQRSDATIVFALFPRGFPLHTEPLLVLEDRPAVGEFGELGRIWFGGAQGLKEYHRSDFDAEGLGQLRRLLDALRTVSLAALEYRAAVNDTASSRQQFEKMHRLERALSRAAESRTDLAQLAVDLAEHLGPKTGDPSVTMAAVLTSTSVMAPAAAADLSPPPSASGEHPATVFDPNVKSRQPYKPEK